MRRREFIGLFGGALAWPGGALAQQPAPSVGLLTPTKIADWALEAYRKGLEETGYVVGRNLTFVARSAEGQSDRLAALAADLVDSRVSVIFATGGPLPVRAAKARTATMPIVFAYGGDPVADGLVDSFNRPGGNITGATFIGSSLSAKRLDLLREIAPRIGDVALLVNPKGTLAESQIKDTTAAALALGLRLHLIDCSSESEIDAAFTAMEKSKFDALLVGTDPLFGFVLAPKIVALAAHHNIPATYDSGAYVDAGGLMSYGPSLADTWRQAGIYSGRILKGEKPGDLPIMQPVKFELIVNAKAAKTLGLTVPPSILAVADKVIE